MIWEDEQAIIEELLYWQKRALKAERKLRKERAAIDEIIGLDTGTEESDDPWKYRS